MEVVDLAGTVFDPSSVVVKANKKIKGLRMEQIPAKFRHPRLGLFTLYEPPQPRLDIVFVHGLQGDPFRTWATSEILWPKDLLPQDIPDARVLTFGYAALVQGETPLTINDLGMGLSQSLTINRRHSKAVTRPLIFMAHSLGGIVVKSALIYSRALSTVDEDSCQISSATCACVFLGTPHIKSDKASWAQMKSQISAALAAHSPSSTRGTISLLASADAEDMLRLSSGFCQQSVSIHLISCFEARPTSTERGRLLVVPKENAMMDMPNEYSITIDADHFEMNKFTNRMDIGYRKIVLHILQTMKDTFSEAYNLGQFSASKMRDEGPAGTESIEGHNTTHKEGGADLPERERQFLSSLRSDWLDDVMIEDNSPGTCEWVLFSQVFQTWLSGSEKTLWIQGNGGAGKSVLAKFLYRQLCGLFAGNAISSGSHRPQWLPSTSKFFSRPHQIRAYFLDLNSPSRNSGLSVLQSLIYQILSADQKLFRHIYGKTVFSRPEQGDFGQYAEIFNAILRDPSMKGTFIVLDALDECELNPRDRIIDILTNLANQSNIQLLLTSRPNENLNARLMLNLSGSAEHVDVDIKTYVKTAVGRLTVARGLSENLRDVITQAILAHSSESFLWVQLVLQRVSKAGTARMIRKVLECLPRNLHDAYSDLLSGLTGSTGVNLRRALYFVVVAEAPIRVKDLSTLLALSHCWNDQDILFKEWSKTPTKLTNRGFFPDLEEITENQILNFERDFGQQFQPLLSMKETCVLPLHDSLTHFLETTSEIDKFHAMFNLQPLEDSYGGDLRQVHDTMAILCLQYMFAAFRGHSDPLDFLAFACICWTMHARKAGDSRSFRLVHSVRQLLSGKDFSSSWLGTVANIQPTQVALLPLKADIAFILAAFDLGSQFGKILGVSAESLQSTDQEGRTPLHLAAANNSLISSTWIQDALCEAGQDPCDLGTRRDSKGESPIFLAAQNGHEELMKLLLFSLDTKYDFDSRLFKIIADSGNIDMFETLYNNTNIKSLDQGMSLLINAAELNSVDLMKRIVFDCGGPNTEIFSFAGVSGDNCLLHVALRKQASQVVEYLLLQKYPPMVMDGNGNTTLHVAAQEGNEQVVEKLIDAGVSVNWVNNDGYTPLRIASRIGLPEIVRTLCRYGANVNRVGPSGCLPAHLAAETGQEELINILLKFGANINSTDQYGRNALHVAAGAGQASTFSALLMKGADANARDDELKTPMHYAVESGNLSILYMLCEVGADLSACDYSHTTPLHLAAKRASGVLVRDLLGLRTDPDVRDLEGRTPLHYCCLSERPAVAVTMLLQKGANVAARDLRGISPIHLAAESGVDAIVRELALFGANLDCEDSNGERPMDYAMKKSNNMVIEVLRELGATDPTKAKSNSLADSRRQTPDSIGFGALEDVDRAPYTKHLEKG